MIRSLAVIALLRSAVAFSPPAPLGTPASTAAAQRRPAPGQSRRRLVAVRLSAPSDALSPSVMGGVRQFEEWFASAAPRSEQKARHAAFRRGTLRGLEYSGDGRRNVIVLPERLVLRTNYNRNRERRVEEGWDADLSVQLVRECLKGEESDLYGYCSLLCRGADFNSVACPPSTAPDALRHWTSPQKARLRRSDAGERLIKTARRQADRWSEWYASLPEEDREIMTEEQFLWAMEAVNSRAFKGNFGGGVVNRLQSLTLPALAAIAGLVFLLASDDETADTIAQFCSLLVVGPALLGLAEESRGPDGAPADAVLLPFIDSANHLEEAKSTIDYNPVTGEFTLEIGRNCQMEEEDGKTQLYVSYGPKTDRELLLNYGFLPGVAGVKADDGEDEEAVRDAQRKRLAEAFVRQNPNF